MAPTGSLDTSMLTNSSLGGGGVFSFSFSGCGGGGVSTITGAGFGFASVLRDIGLPPRGLVLSLLSFNVGVELGQLAVVAMVAPALWLFANWRGTARQLLALAALSALAIAVLSRFDLPMVSLIAVAVGAPLFILGWLPRVGYRRTIRTGGSIVLLILSTLWLFERVLQRSFFGGWLG